MPGFCNIVLAVASKLQGQQGWPAARGRRKRMEERLLAEKAGYDREAFGELFRANAGLVFKVIMGRVRNESEAWDITQDAFVKAIENIDSFEGRARFSSWVIRIALNETYDRVRKKGREINGWDEIPENIEERNPLSELLDKENLGRLVGAFNRLSEEERLLLELKIGENLSSEQIAAIIGKQDGATRVAIHRARKKLAEFMEESNEE